MITVRIRHICPDTKAETIARVTAVSIQAALMRYPGAVVFPIEPEEFFSGSGPKSFSAVEILEPEGAVA